MYPVLLLVLKSCTTVGAFDPPFPGGFVGFVFEISLAEVWPQIIILT